MKVREAFRDRKSHKYRYDPLSEYRSPFNRFKTEVTFRPSFELRTFEACFLSSHGSMVI